MGSKIESLGRVVGHADIVKALAVLDFNYNTPELSETHADLRLGIWLSACGELPLEVFQQACRDHIKTSKFFPRPAEINDLAGKPLDALKFQADVEAHTHARKTGKHPDRFTPPAFPMDVASIRSNPIWADFLDAIHPAHEHYFFAKAKFGDYAHVLRNLSKFEAERIWYRFGDELDHLFYSPVVLIPDRHIEGVPIAKKQARLKPIDAIEIARRGEVIAAAKRKYGYWKQDSGYSPAFDYEPPKDGPNV